MYCSNLVSKFSFLPLSSVKSQLYKLNKKKIDAFFFRGDHDIQVSE